MRALPLFLALLLAFASGEVRAQSPGPKEGLRLAIDRLWVNKRQDGFYFMELFRFEGKLPPGEGLHFPLPAKAKLLDDPHGKGRKNFIREPGGLLLKEGVPPKGKMVAVAYAIGGKAERFLWKRPFLYPTDSFEVLVKKGELTVKAAGMKLLGETKFGGATFLRYVYPRAGAGARIALEVGPPGRGLDFRPFYYAIVAVLLLGSLTWAAIRRRGGKERETLLRAIALLDDELAEGSISEAEHRKLRQEKVRRLRAITELSRERDGAQG